MTTTIAEVAAAHPLPNGPERVKVLHLHDAPPLKFDGTPPSCSPTSTARATPPSDAEKATASCASSPASTPRDDGSRFDGYMYAATTASADTDVDAASSNAEAASSGASTPPRNRSSSRFDRHGTATSHGAEDAAAADEEKAAEALPSPLLPGDDDDVRVARHSHSHPHPPPGLLRAASSTPSVNGERRPGALRSLARTEKGLALLASSAWSNDGVAADTVPTLTEEAARRWRAESTARRKAMQKKASVLRFITTRSWDDPAWRVGPKKRRLGVGGSGSTSVTLDGAEAGRLAPAFCCTAPVVEPAPHAARTWDAFPPGREEFAHVTRDPATRRRVAAAEAAAAAAAAARGRSTPEAEVKEEEEEGVLFPTASAAASAAAAVSLFNTAALAAGGGQADSPFREAVLEGLVLPCGPSDDEKVYPRKREGCLACITPSAALFGGVVRLT